MIYFIRQVSTGYIKIGCARNLWGRMVMLKKKFGEVELIGVLYGHRPGEYKLHSLFNQLNVAHISDMVRVQYGREWFHPEPELTSYITTNSSIELMNILLERRKNARKTRAERIVLRVNLLLGNSDAFPGLAKVLLV